MLGHSDDAPAHVYDLVMLDLDGVVYIGGEAVPGAPEHLRAARHDDAAGTRLAFVTNNASRTPDVVAQHLVELGVEATAEDVVTSAQAAARLLADRLAPGTAVAVLGAAALRDEVTSAGLRPVAPDDDEARAVVSGYGPDVLWRDVMRTAVRVRDGLWWVASNTDGSIPTDFGVAPGHGVLVETISRFSGVDPAVAGKPSPPLLEETVRRVGGERPLMVGDRLDTDIAGARAVGLDSLLVMTGVTGLDELLAAVPGERPTYLAADLAGLTTPHPEVELDDAGAVELGGWHVSADDGALTCTGSGSPHDWWRAVATAGWAHLDRTGEVVAHDTLTPPDPSGSGGGAQVASDA